MVKEVVDLESAISSSNIKVINKNTDVEQNQVKKQADIIDMQ